MRTWRMKEPLLGHDGIMACIWKISQCSSGYLHFYVLHPHRPSHRMAPGTISEEWRRKLFLSFTEYSAIQDSAVEWIERTTFDGNRIMTIFIDLLLECLPPARTYTPHRVQGDNRGKNNIAVGAEKDIEGWVNEWMAGMSEHKFLNELELIFRLLIFIIDYWIDSKSGE